MKPYSRLKQRLRKAALLLCLFIIPAGAKAQFPIGGGGAIPVIDEQNLAQNLLTAVRMGIEIGLSEQQLETMVRNLIPALDLPIYPLLEYEALLIGMSESAGPRPFTPRNLDYFQPDLQPEMQRLYPGTEPMYNHPQGLYGTLADTELNTIESAMGRLNVEAGIESDIRYDVTREELKMQNDVATGNLQAHQAGNAISLSVGDGVRRLEKSNAEIANLIAVHNANTRQREAWGDAIMSYSLELAGVNEPTPQYDPGAPGSVLYVEPVSQGGDF